MVSEERGRIPRPPDVLVFAAIMACCLIPHRPRLQHPSIYADDIARVADLQMQPLASLLFRPFNEHMAPFFETISWATWQAAGRRLSHAPIAFTLSSYVPFVLCLGLLGWLVRRETGSRTTALATIALFGISPLYAETVFLVFRQ